MPGGDGVLTALLDPYTFPLTAFLPGHTGAPGGRRPGRRAGPGSNRLFLDGEVHAHGAVGLLVAGDVASARP